MWHPLCSAALASPCSAALASTLCECRRVPGPTH
jgi:hypothetical protein